MPLSVCWCMFLTMILYHTILISSSLFLNLLWAYFILRMNIIYHTILLLLKYLYLYLNLTGIIMVLYFNALYSDYFNSKIVCIKEQSSFYRTVLYSIKSLSSLYSLLLQGTFDAQKTSHRKAS
mgnify:FL=1